MPSRASEQNAAKEVLTKYFQDVSNDSELAQFFADTLGPEGAEYLLEHITGVAEECYETLDPSFAQFMDVKAFSEKEKTTLEINSLYNYFNRRRDLLASSIGSVEAADLLGVSKQTIHDRVRDKKLIGLVESNVMRLPLFQFDPAGPNGAVAGLSDVLKELSGSLLGKISWLVTANAVLDNSPPIEVMKRGDLDRVLIEARSVGVS